MNSPYDSDRNGKGTEAASKREETKSPLRLAPAPTSQPVDFSAEILRKLTYAIGKDPIVARNHDWLAATILAVRDRVIDRWMASTRDTYQAERKRVYYLSLEFLIGRLLRDAISNLGLTDDRARGAAAASTSISTSIAELEPDAALGNGGLGRLAACFMESMATVDIPAYGYGIRYDHGLFRQKIIDGWQVELPEDWLVAWQSLGVRAPRIRLRDRLRRRRRGNRPRPMAAQQYVWKPGEVVLAIAFDTPIVGWRGKRVNTLRLWSARADRSDPARCLQQRRPCRRAERADARGEHHPRALSLRRDAGRAGAAAAPGIFLHLGLAAGSAAPPSPAIQGSRATSPTRPPSSSTTPIRRSPWRS